MKKARPCDLNQKIKRLQSSRDKLKINNFEKLKKNKKLRDRNVEITESRNQWKKRSKDLCRQKEDLEQQLRSAKEEAEQERIRATQECERANKLQSDIEEIWKKKSRT